MTCEFEFHPLCFVLLPALAITIGEHEETGALHGWQLQVSFLVFTFHLTST